MERQLEKLVYFVWTSTSSELAVGIQLMLSMSAELWLFVYNIVP